MRVAPALAIDDSQRETLMRWARSRTLSARQIERAKVVLLAADGKSDLEIAAGLQISNKKAARWRKRFLRVGLPGLEKDASRPGRKPAIATSVKLEFDPQDHPIIAAQRDALEHAHHGCRNGC